MPVIAFEGTLDNTIPRGFMREWKQHATIYRHKLIRGGTHYFVSTHYQKVIFSSVANVPRQPLNEAHGFAFQVTYELGNECLRLQEAQQDGRLGANHSWMSGSNRQLEMRNASEQVVHAKKESLADKIRQLSYIVTNAKEDVLDALAEEVRWSKLQTCVAIVLGWLGLLMLSAIALDSN